MNSRKQNTRQHRITASVIAVLVFSWAINCPAQNAPPPVPAEEQPEVLTRGPVHEAFAEPVNLEFQAGLVASVQPPANIEEIPPAERPAGDGFVWVPGYWSWDGDRNNYIWVSACWRVAPPEMSWVPGYWAAVNGGWEWVAGFWTPAGAQEIEYLPAPPASDDPSPPGPPPSANQIWVPSCQYWTQDQYTRRPGYWLAAQPGWVWTPSHYVRTPRGYVFCAGHWDYALENRGVLFAPVYFPPSVYGRAQFTYSPSIVIDLGGLTASLFAYPRYNHYYFGDYYGNAYISIGIYPWFDAERMHTWYDPIYQYDRWHFGRTEPRWEERERHEYALRRADRDLRPARTYHEMETRLARLPEPQRANLRLAEPLTTVVAGRTTSVRFERMNTSARQKIAKQATEVQKFREQRNHWESTATDRTRAQLPGHKDAVIAPAQRTQQAAPPIERKQQAAPPIERKQQAAPPIERKQQVAPPIERKQQVAPPIERKQQAAPPIERKQQAAPPIERKQQAAPPIERKQQAAPPIERKQQAAPPTERNAAPVPPREGRATQSERVKIPARPVAGRTIPPSSAEKGPPARPADERKAPAGAKDARNDEGKGKKN